MPLLVVGLFGMLHAATLAELEAGAGQNSRDLWANSYAILDPVALDSRSLDALMSKSGVIGTLT